LSSAAVFLDRDGVLVELVWDAADGAFEGPTVADDVRLVPGAADAVRRIRSLDYRTVVVSNQPGAAKGKASREDLHTAHERVVRLLAERGVVIDEYRYCLHHPDAVDAGFAGALDVDLSRSWMIGDSDVDAAAGRAAGCRTILVENPQSTHRRRDGARVDHRATDLVRAVEILAGEAR
jgi:D-glycero-D-manno-heptose 1,7-bisphosphate phosphatase